MYDFGLCSWIKQYIYLKYITKAKSPLLRRVLHFIINNKKHTQNI